MERVVGIIVWMSLLCASFDATGAQAQAYSLLSRQNMADGLQVDDRAILDTSRLVQDTSEIMQDTSRVTRTTSFVLQDTVGNSQDTLIAPMSPVIATPDTVTATKRRVRTNGSFDKKVDSVLTLTTSDALFAPSYLFKPSPSKAVLYSAIFPGLGQIYNRKYWKLPIVYGGFVGFTYAITWNNGYYRYYLEGYQDIMDDNPQTNRWENILPYGMDAETVDQQWFTQVLQQRKDYYRHYRDMSIILTVGWYLLAMVDAYVDAQLFDFDMSTDLSLRVQPAVLRDDNSRYLGNSYGLQWSFEF